MAARSSRRRAQRAQGTPQEGAWPNPADGNAAAATAFAGAPAIDGCIDAVPACPSAPVRARLDLSGRAVVVTWRSGPVLMVQRLALNSYEAVAAELVAAPAEGQDPTVRLVLRHPTAVYSTVLATNLPLDEAVAAWRRWADRLSVGMSILDHDGEASNVRTMLGAVAVRPAQRRRQGAPARRRPRFAKRRALR
ncbi:MAG: hypothetical protein KI785_10490 [Devosiaceae bacterium]|nr:hypothetical protein [Devosiaceae bacterium MH13]